MVWLDFVLLDVGKLGVTTLFLVFFFKKENAFQLAGSPTLLAFTFSNESNRIDP
jgi:hypothetical protein